MPVSLAVALGGAIGSLGRYGLDRLIRTPQPLIVSLGHVPCQRDRLPSHRRCAVCAGKRRPRTSSVFAGMRVERHM